MNDHPHSHDEPKPPSPETPVDVGSQALAEALQSSFAIVKVVMILLVVVFFASGFFKVDPNEQAIILRFGKPVGEGEKALLGSGLHWSLPYPIEEYVRVRVTDVQKVDSTVGWYFTTRELELAGNEPPANNNLNPAADGYTLSADGNIIHVRATLLYRISDPIRYVFDFENASNVVRHALDNALVFASATFKVDDILTRDKTGFQEAVRKRASDLLDKENVGVSVERCDIETKYPRQYKVREAFVNVLNAEITRNQQLNEAISYRNQVVSKAEADASSLTNAAEADRRRLVATAASQASAFRDILPRFKANPALFTQERLTATMARALTNVQDKIYLPDRLDGKPRELRLLLNREPVKPVQTNQVNAAP